MMGLFSEYQPHYAELGIATFPCEKTEGDGRKKPIVSNYQKMGLRASADLAGRKKFAGIDAFGFLAGARNGITVLDVDIPDRAVLDAAIERHGEPRLIVQTASGKFHAYYRHNRERRGIRAWGDELPIDLLGGGVVVAPPSVVEGHRYQIIRGNLDDIRNLTTLRGIEGRLYEERKTTQATAPADARRHPEKVRQGRRNKWLWTWCMKAAHHCDDLDALIDVALTKNEECEPPLEEKELMTVVQSAWGYTQEGRNRFGQHGAWIPLPEVDSMMQEPDAFALLAWLRAHQGSESTFWIANGLAENFGWRRHRFAAARSRLIELDYIVQIQKPFQGSNALYRWA